MLWNWFFLIDSLVGIAVAKLGNRNNELVTVHHTNQDGAGEVTVVASHGVQGDKLNEMVRWKLQHLRENFGLSSLCADTIGQASFGVLFSARWSSFVTVGCIIQKGQLFAFMPVLQRYLYVRSSHELHYHYHNHRSDIASSKSLMEEWMEWYMNSAVSYINPTYFPPFFSSMEWVYHRRTYICPIKGRQSRSYARTLRVGSS